jgi:hypothetical protein
VLSEPIGPRADRGRAAEGLVTQQLAVAWSDTIRTAPTQWAAVYPMRWRALPAAGHPTLGPSDHVRARAG